MMYRMKVRINKYLEVRDDTMKEITMLGTAQRQRRSASELTFEQRTFAVSKVILEGSTRSSTLNLVVRYKSPGAVKVVLLVKIAVQCPC